MAARDTRKKWFAKVAEQLGSIDGVDCEIGKDGGVALEISHGGDTATLVLAGPAAGFADRKDQYARLRETLTALGIEEGATYVPPPPPASGPRSQRAGTPAMHAARAERKQAFEAWQDVWRTIRRAEEALEVEYEIAQMRDYY